MPARLLRRLGVPPVLLTPVVVQITLLWVTHDDYRSFLIALWLVLAISFFAWWRTLVRARTILDMPTARIASAAQGYTELLGRGRPLEGIHLLSPATGLPVLWHRTYTYRKRGMFSLRMAGSHSLFRSQWDLIDSQESDASFLLDDGSGACCVIDPEGAEMLIHRHDVYYRADNRIEEWCLLPGNPTYVLGEFTTLGSISPEMDTQRQIKELLEQWKADKPELLRRFDLDGNGTIDMREWELARAEARRQVLRQQRKIHTAPELHIMRKPKGRLYLISDHGPHILANRFRRWAIFHALSFFATAAALAWFYQRGQL